ncbi:hypothetical protein A2160_01430 [Candidatus Beckwithbacteria bacterium RBG_13_42_9]|uniref:Glycosyltransferase RgtA/B/C/D-like domain-containing protein n=1 Tax=Candidatus Beckwithbacteria bacterium RBG_13_42_9 TaxID=1797457 RepID=A0A1F5E9C0_9BACT|nr:MAG: hypothetical protein A2160_01430 [Candidatus Beckwithbacteria bacterium RBG_13_42_9]
MRKADVYLVILLLVALVSLLMTTVPIFSGIFPFTFDQGRDLLWVKNQVDFKRPSLLGPWGSLSGVYFGPLWFWLLTLPYLFFQGNPVGITLFNALVVFSALFLGAWLFKRPAKTLAYFFLLLGFLSPAVQGISRYAFSQHLLPILTLLLIYSYAQILYKKSRLHFILAALWIGLMFHAEPPLSIFSIPPWLIVTWLSHKKKKFLNLKLIILALMVFLISLFPLALFDLRHGFLQTKTVLAYLMGKNKSLGDILPFWQRLLDRPYQFFLVFQASIFPKSFWICLGIFLLTIYFNLRNKTKNFINHWWQVSLIYMASLLIIFIFYPPQLKSFYLDGLIMIYLFWAARGLTYVWGQKKHLLVAGTLILAFWFNLEPWSFFKSYRLGFGDQLQQGSLFINQTRALDWIYQKANGQGFTVYTYVPPVYDYNYQYLFFWYGLKHYGYLPEEFSYLPNQPEYVQKKSEQLIRLQDKIKPGQGEVYLILEKEGYSDRQEKWLQQFSSEEYSLIEKAELPGNILVSIFNLRG